jgi:hypothetical protein
MLEEIKTYYCRRIRSEVCGEKMEDISQRIIVHCKFYNYMNENSKLPCLLDTLNHKKCLVKLAIRKEAKVNLSS